MLIKIQKTTSTPCSMRVLYIACQPGIFQPETVCFPVEKKKNKGGNDSAHPPLFFSLPTDRKNDGYPQKKTFTTTKDLVKQAGWKS